MFGSLCGIVAAVWVGAGRLAGFGHLSHKQTLGGDALVVGAEEKGGDKRQLELVVLLDAHVLLFALLVDPDKEVVAGGELDDVAALLAHHGDEAYVVEPFDARLVELVVDGRMARGDLVVVAVGVEHRTGHEQVELAALGVGAVLVAEEFVGSGAAESHYLLHGVVGGDCFRESVEVAGGGRDGAGFDLLAGYRVETVEKVYGTLALGVALGIEQALGKPLADFRRQVGEHLEGDVDIFELVALGDGASVDALGYGVRGETLDYAAEIGVQRTRRDGHVGIVHVVLVIGGKLYVAGEFAHRLGVADAGAEREIIECRAESQHGSRDKLMTVAGRGRGEGFLGDNSFSHRSEAVFDGVEQIFGGELLPVIGCAARSVVADFGGILRR